MMWLVSMGDRPERIRAVTKHDLSQPFLLLSHCLLRGIEVCVCVGSLSLLERNDKEEVEDSCRCSQQYAVEAVEPSTMSG